eukprot:Phypoly_transcript_03664.p2 GENE.Phypoly_transcript_03664~~Phypoly_transcript_03664.p2  ORF type:complete len:368 (-),score=107.24 Phypoly_transcript_03664:101-1204(-)
MVIGTTEDVKNKILVVSSVAETPSLLLKKLIGKDNLVFKTIYSDEIHTTGYEIDNKYYTADVEFWLLNQHTYPPAQLPINTDKLSDLCEALILVFDATKQETFEKLHGWSQFVEEFNPNVLLCVGIGKSDNKHVYTEWCVDNGLEYVEVIEASENPSTSASTSENSASSQAPTEEEEETEDDRFGSGAEGKDRILEALGSTMWENMKQKARRLEDQFSMLSLGGRGGLGGLGGLGDLGEDSDPENELSLGPGPAPTFDPLNFDEDLRLARGEFRAATNDISQNLRALQSFLRETEAPRGVDGIEGEEGEEKEGEGGLDAEASVEHFESALTGLRRLRESAQQLPDSQRKALAAQVISMLFPDEEDWQ